VKVATSLVVSDALSDDNVNVVAEAGAARTRVIASAIAEMTLDLSGEVNM
jgi:superfamily I DNA/RNA helicase